MTLIYFFIIKWSLQSRKRNEFMDVKGIQPTNELVYRPLQTTYVPIQRLKLL